MRCALPSPGVRVSTSGRATRERRLRSLHVRCSSSSDQTATHVLTFVTGNQGKVDRLRLAMSLQSGCGSFEVDGIDLALHEIQADTVLEVALAKAKSAHEILQRPLLIHDCGLYGAEGCAGTLYKVLQLHGGHGRVAGADARSAGQTRGLGRRHRLHRCEWTRSQLQQPRPIWVHRRGFNDGSYQIVTFRGA